MSREIKFRAIYDHMGGGWKYGMLIYEGKVPRIQVDGTMTFASCLKGTEGQYTGLKDKNGKEIYEGDIVKHGSAGVISKISFEDGSFAVSTNNKVCLRHHGMDLFEIIGNIYETPELLTNIHDNNGL